MPLAGVCYIHKAGLPLPCRITRDSGNDPEDTFSSQVPWAFLKESSCMPKSRKWRPQEGWSCSNGHKFRQFQAKIPKAYPGKFSRLFPTNNIACESLHLGETINKTTLL